MAIKAKEALTILRQLSNDEEAAHRFIPTGENTPEFLVYLSDVAAATSPLADASGDCRHAGKRESFIRETLPMKEMAQFAIHLITCIRCRALLSAKGIHPFQRSTEILRQALEVEKKA